MAKPQNFKKGIAQPFRNNSISEYKHRDALLNIPLFPKEIPWRWKINMKAGLLLCVYQLKENTTNFTPVDSLPILKVSMG